MNVNSANTTLQAAKTTIEMVLRNEVTAGGLGWDAAVDTIAAQMVCTSDYLDTGIALIHLSLQYNRSSPLLHAFRG